MIVSEQISSALIASGISDEPINCVSLTGGCIHEVTKISFRNHAPVVCKCSLEQAGDSQLNDEAFGLNSLKNLSGNPMRVPAVIGAPGDTGQRVLILEWLEPASPADSMWISFGEDLAGMHDLCAGPQYGFEQPNYIGATRQLNNWHSNWVEFNQACRLGPQVQWARDSGLLDADEAKCIDQVIASLDRHLPASPHPSMLHGDLWSGNLIPLQEGRIALVDPACSIGDGWADIAMMQLFGGIPRACFDSYAQGRTDCEQDLESRIEIYQLYHVLNHVNLFGGGYVSQAMSIVDRLARR